MTTTSSVHPSATPNSERPRGSVPPWDALTATPSLMHAQQAAARAALDPATTSAAERIATLTAELDAVNKSQAVIEFEMDGTIRHANDKFLSALGYTLEEIRGRHHRMFVEGAFARSSEYAAFWAKLNRGEYEAKEYKRVGKGGKEVWIQASYNPILDHNGKSFKVVKYATDVTAEKLRTADFESQMRAVNKAHAVIEFDMQGTILHANDNFLNTLGDRLEEVRGRHHRMFVDAAVASSAAYAEFWARLNRGDYEAKEYKRVGKGGKEVWIQASYNPILDLSGKPFKVVKYATDITEKVEMQQNMTAIISEIGDHAQTLSAAAEQLSATSAQMSTTANSTSEGAKAVSAASHEVTDDVQTVASGAEEMSCSIREIAKSANDAARVAMQAVQAADSANNTVAKLGESSAEIGKVIKVITSVAQQTNLLALNATIEAARAGDAGKGFAVVANEVKELPKATAKATEDIAQKIEAIQEDTTGAVNVIAQIGQIINWINDHQNTAASAVEQQTATTNEIARNVSEAARGSSAIADNMVGLATGAEETARGAQETEGAAVGLSKLASELQSLVDAFNQR